MESNLWLIGAGNMALAYAKVFNGLGISYFVIGRGNESACNFEKQTCHEVIRGGLEKHLSLKPVAPDFSIVSVGIDKLSEVTSQLLRYGVKKILVEKPAGLSKEEISTTCQLSKEVGVDVYVAYNRRFYTSVIKAKEIIEEDGGVKSFSFEFTEWIHRIKELKKAPEVMEKWFLANSSHVVDMAFYLGGIPKDISCYTSGNISWHSSSIFAGSGISENGALFSYQANWEAPGRWEVEILTKKHRLVFRPLEKLQVQKIGSLEFSFIDIDDELDINYKPGLYRQIENFLNNNIVNFCTIKKQSESFDLYYKMAGY